MTDPEAPRDDPVKMVIVMRTRFPDGKGGTFGMRTGKMVVQGSHAASAFLIDKVMRHEAARLCGVRTWTALEQEWLSTGMTKICLQVDGEEELLDVHRRAREAGLTADLVTDAGRTEFKEPTRTCVAIGPARASAIDAITGGLPLL